MFAYTCYTASFLMALASLVERHLLGGASGNFRFPTGIALIVLASSLLGAKDVASGSKAWRACLLASGAALFSIGADIALWSVGVDSSMLTAIATLGCAVLGLRGSVLARQHQG